MAKFAVLENGMSVPVAWIFCRGPVGCPVARARYELRSLSELPEGAIQTKEDREAIEGIIARAVKVLLAENGFPAEETQKEGAENRAA